MKLKNVLLAELLAFSTLQVVAQTGNEAGWKLVKTENNVSVYTETGECRTSEVVFFKMQNNGDQTVEIHWSAFGKTQEKTLSLKPGESFMGDCNNRMPMSVLKEMIPQGKTISDLQLKLDVKILNK